MASNTRQSILPPREVLVGWLARLYRHGLTTTTGGNLSLIDDDGTMYIAPSGGDKAIVPPEKVAVRKPGETEFHGISPPSMEWPLHVAAYETKSEARAVLHAHSMSLVAFSLAAATTTSNGGCDPRLPDTRVLLGAYQACGKVAFCGYDIPGSKALAEGCRAAFAKGADCVILENHGVVVVGKDLPQAYDRFVSLEYLARSMVHGLSLHTTMSPLSPLLLKYATDLDNPASNNPFPKSLPACSPTYRLMTGVEKEQRAKLCQFVHRAYHQNLVTSSSGSFSTRCGSDNDNLSFIITPTGVDRQSLEATDLCFVTTNRSSSSGSNGTEEPCKKKVKLEKDKKTLWFHPSLQQQQQQKPSRAAAVHGSIYKLHSEVKHVMVVQPPYSTAYCIYNGSQFNSAGNPESHVILQHVQTLPIEAVLERDGQALAQALDPSNGKNVVLVEGYGLITAGKDLLQTFVQVEVCESMCGVTLTALRRGSVALLNKAQVEDLNVAFKKGH